MDKRQIRHHLTIPETKADRILNEGFGMLIANDEFDQVQAGDELIISTQEDSGKPVCDHPINDCIYKVVEVASKDLRAGWKAVLVKYIKAKED